MANATRYGYLRGPTGRFRNPYDHGLKKNCSDFLVNGQNEDVEFVELSADSEGIRMMNIPTNPTMQNGNAHSHHVAVDINNSNGTKVQHGHVHSAHCSHNNHSKSKADSAPIGLGLGLGRGSNRSIAAS